MGRSRGSPTADSAGLKQGTHGDNALLPRASSLTAKVLWATNIDIANIHLLQFPKVGIRRGTQERISFTPVEVCG